MKLNWTDEAVTFLIELFKSGQFMWDTEHAFYKNRLKRSRFVEDVACELNEHFPMCGEFSSVEVLRKWNNIKSYYTVTKNKIFQMQKSGASDAAIENVEGGWKFLTQLNFMNAIPMETSLSNKSNKRSLRILQSEGPSFSPSLKWQNTSKDMSETFDPLFESQDFHHVSYISNGLLKDTNTAAASTSSAAITPNTTSFVDWVSFELSKLDDDLQLEAERKIIEVLMDSKEKQLQRKRYKQEIQSTI